LAFIGASIVLLTFVLREVVRDHFKDLATSLQQAQDVFAMQRQLESIDKNLIWLINHHSQQGAPVQTIAKTGPTFEDTTGSVNDLLEQDINAIDDLQAMQESLDRLLEKLPTSFYPPELKQYHADLAQWRAQRDQMESQIGQCDDIHEPNAICSDAFVKEMDQKSDQLDINLMLQRISLSKLSEPVLANAQKELKKREYWYAIANIGSVIFFTTGWLIGLIGAIYRVPAIASTTEI